MPFLRVGICLTNSKKLKMNLPSSLFEICHKSQIEVVDIDMERNLEQQGPFDIILHKILEWSNEDKELGSVYLEKFKNYLSRHQNVILIDPIDTGIKLTNRMQMLEAARNCEFSLNGRRVFVPNFTFIDRDCDSSRCELLLSNSNIVFPVIIKHHMGACFGKRVHDMSIVLNKNNLSDMQPPCIIQRFHNHNGTMVKIYVIGEKFYLCKRPSVKNLQAGSFPTLFFNSCEVSKRGRTSLLHDNDLTNIDFPAGEDKTLLEEEIVIELLQRLSSEFNFHLLGIDIIIDNATGDYGIVDVNYFPGYDGVKSQVPKDLVDLFTQVASLQ